MSMLELNQSELSIVSGRGIIIDACNFLGGVLVLWMAVGMPRPRDIGHDPDTRLHFRQMFYLVFCAVGANFIGSYVGANLDKN